MNFGNKVEFRQYGRGGHNAAMHGTDQQQVAVKQQESKLKLINFDLADIYFPMYVIQINWDVFPLRNRNFKTQSLQATEKKSDGNQMLNNRDESNLNDLAIMQHDLLRQQYEQNCKIFFILRDQYLLTKVQITGIIVFYIKKEDKHFFGIDDSTGVATCVLWLNDFNNSRSNAGNRQNDLRAWLINQNVKVGDCLSILGVLEYFKDKTQINIHKLRVIEDVNEEMLQYQQADAAQQCYFDPTQPFKRRLFDSAWQKNQIQKNQSFAADITRKDRPSEPDGDATMHGQQPGDQPIEEVNLHNRKRVQKNLNNFILNEYHKLIGSEPVIVDSANQTGANEPKNSRMFKKSDMINSPLLLEKAKEELKFCADRVITPAEIILICLDELESQGFLNLTENESAEHMYQIRDQRDKLKELIIQLLQNNVNNKSGKAGMNFDQIYKAVDKKFKNFFTKDPVFKAIDELFQQGQIYEVAKCSYAYLDNKF